MFMERMALEATLRRERVTSEAPTYRRLHPYRRTPRWQERLLTHLSGLMVAQGTALQRRYRRAVELARRPVGEMQVLPRQSAAKCANVSLRTTPTL